MVLPVCHLYSAFQSLSLPAAASPESKKELLVLVIVYSPACLFKRREKVIIYVSTH